MEVWSGVKKYQEHLEELKKYLPENTPEERKKLGYIKFNRIKKHKDIYIKKDKFHSEDSIYLKFKTEDLHLYRWG